MRRRTIEGASVNECENENENERSECGEVL
jgi:hypothetical protein